MTSGQNGGPNRGQNERLRALLADARERLALHMETYFAQHKGTMFLTIGLIERIDAALAEPDEAEETEHAMHMRIRAGYDRVIADSWRAKVAEVERERDEARAEAERLRALLDGVVGACKYACSRESHCGVCAIALQGINP